MLISVVIISRDEAPRLRLVLASLAAQDLSGAPAGQIDFEVVVVDDGSTDGTRAVLDGAKDILQLRVVRHEESRGRSASRNAAVRAASGDVIVLLDGDCLASPQLVARHAQVHSAGSNIMGKGETYHLRCTRFFRDPETGSPMPGQEERVRKMGDEFRKSLITVADIRERFETIAARGEPGIYAGAGPRRLYELEMRALRTIPNASVLWMTAPGQNWSMRRADFESAKGFNEGLTLNEHRELAFRLTQRGARMVPVEGARSFHMLHRIGWRDPANDTAWEREFFRLHPCLATKLMNVFWLSLAGDKDVAIDSRIESLEQMESILTEGATIDYDAVRRNHPRLCSL
jgi:glycosyltransferase involved in cell wall biosynthesis